MTDTILVIEDEQLFAKAVCKRLRQAEFNCVIESSLAGARRFFGKDNMSPELMLLDMRLPDGSGLDFLRELRDQGQEVPVVVLTAFGELEDAVDAMKLQALDYLKKPVDLDELTLSIRKVLDKVALSRQLQYSRQRESHQQETVQLIGNSIAMQRTQTQLKRISQLLTQAKEKPPALLIMGETGTGKDICARWLHEQSVRCDRPFVQVDCAALPSELIEAELFGHEKGAYTGAQGSRTGLIEAAEDGTVFLDEIGELSIDLQAKLLAVLGRRQVRRIGSTHELPVAAWFIAATHRPLAEWVENGQFRSDLYYRLNSLSINLPPLRDRDKDCILLAEHFIQITAKRYSLPVSTLSESARKTLQGYHWPGNIRELRHLIERAVLLGDGKILTAEDLSLTEQPDIPPPEMLPSNLAGLTLDQAERLLLMDALERTGHNVSRAARILGITRMAMRYRMQKHGLGQLEE